MLCNLQDNLNCLTKFLNQLPRQPIFVLPKKSGGVQDICWLSYRMMISKTILDCLPDYAQPRQSWLSDRLDACKTILNCLAECILPRQSKIVWPNGFSKTIAIVLPKVNCLASFKIVFLLCLVLARQSVIVLPLPLCLCYLQLSCLSIVLQVQMLCL